MKRFLGLSGSLRRMSTNAALLRAMAANLPEGVALDLYDGMGDLPIFNPDREGEHTPQPVLDLAAQVRQAGGLIIACPEYAHGIPGGLKNLLDWLVSRDEIPFKPVLLLRASSRNDISHAALQEVLRTMSVALMPDTGLSIHLLGKTPAEIEEILAAADMRLALRGAVQRFMEWIGQRD